MSSIFHDHIIVNLLDLGTYFHLLSQFVPIFQFRTSSEIHFATQLSVEQKTKTIMFRKNFSSYNKLIPAVQQI